ncbi:MAG: protein-disulfide reductase DsbD N-terminal domain-containing protein [Acidobacteriota bacterium]
MLSGRFLRGARLVISASLIVTAIAIAGGAQEQLDPIHWSIQLEAQQGPVKPGDKLTVQVTAKMDEGWHLYSLDQEPGGPIPTRIRLPEDQLFKLSDTIDSPAPRVEMDPNFNIETQFYEEEVTFNLPLVVVANAATGKHDLRVNVTYQTCTSTKCLPPKLVKLIAELSIVASGK